MLLWIWQSRSSLPPHSCCPWWHSDKPMRPSTQPCVKSLGRQRCSMGNSSVFVLPFKSLSRISASRSQNVLTRNWIMCGVSDVVRVRLIQLSVARISNRLSGRRFPPRQNRGGGRMGTHFGIYCGLNIERRVWPHRRSDRKITSGRIVRTGMKICASDREVGMA